MINKCLTNCWDHAESEKKKRFLQMLFFKWTVIVEYHLLVPGSSFDISGQAAKVVSVKNCGWDCVCVSSENIWSHHFDLQHPKKETMQRTPLAPLPTHTHTHVLHRDKDARPSLCGPRGRIRIHELRQMVSIRWGMHAAKCLHLTGIPWRLSLRCGMLFLSWDCRV